MSAHVIFNLLNKLVEKDQMYGCALHGIAFSQLVYTIVNSIIHVMP